MTYQTYKNFLTTDFFEKLKNIILHRDFPWRRRDAMTPNAQGEMYFTHNFYNQMNSKSEFYRAGWRAAEKGVYRKEPDGDNPFYAEFESGYEDQVANSER